MCYKVGMNDYLVYIKDNPSIPDKELLEYLRLYGMVGSKAKLTLLLLRKIGVAPAGTSDHDKAIERQEFFAACGPGIECEIVYTNKPPHGPMGELAKRHRS